MARLCLITGFLGAGKTSLLKGLVRQFADARIAVIVNEFGREGVDGELLRAAGIAVEEICNGSIFCSCRLDQFEDALKEAAASGPELILVEASGLSDPGSVGEILGQEKFAEISYMGSLCLVDAVNFEKVLATVRVCKKQLAVSRLILINKTDLAFPEQVRRVRGLLGQLAPRAAVHETSFGRIEPEWLEELSRTGGGDAIFQTKDLGLQKRLITLNGGMSRRQLEQFLQMFLEDTCRVKGFVHCGGELYLVDCVGADCSIGLFEGTVKHPDALVALAGPGMPLSKSLAAAAKWYPDYVKSID